MPPFIHLRRDFARLLVSFCPPPRVFTPISLDTCLLQHDGSTVSVHFHYALIWTSGAMMTYPWARKESTAYFSDCPLRKNCISESIMSFLLLPVSTFPILRRCDVTWPRSPKWEIAQTLLAGHCSEPARFAKSLYLQCALCFGNVSRLCTSCGSEELAYGPVFWLISPSLLKLHLTFPFPSYSDI